MPGVIALAHPTTVLPFGLCSAYQRAKRWDTRESKDYPDGSSQRSVLVQSERSTWTLSRKLTFAQDAAMQAFYSGQRGPLIPFFFYDLYESRFAYDPTGVQGIGRYIVRFDCPLSMVIGIARNSFDFTLVQVD
jgi:hypothetical protein